MTFSIVAYDPREQAFGVAVASKFLAVGMIVPWAQAGVGAVATQANGRLAFGPEGLSELAKGKSAQETLAALLGSDPLRETRQVGIVDAQGRAAAHTGRDCYDWAGHRIGEGFTCQGNILAGQQVVEAMAETFLSAKGELGDRLYAALVAGDAAGGDRRGRQSAALLVARANPAFGGDNDRYLDLRVDDDPQPMAKMAEQLTLHQLYFGVPKPEDRLPITEALARELQAYMRVGGYSAAEPNGTWDDAAIRSFDAMVGSENLEARWRNDDANVIDRVALDYLRAKFGK